jgi:hypothetical protein
LRIPLRPHTASEIEDLVILHFINDFALRGSTHFLILSLSLDSTSLYVLHHPAPARITDPGVPYLSPQVQGVIQPISCQLMTSARQHGRQFVPQISLRSLLQCVTLSPWQRPYHGPCHRTSLRANQLYDPVICPSILIERQNCRARLPTPVVSPLNGSRHPQRVPVHVVETPLSSQDPCIRGSIPPLTECHASCLAPGLLVVGLVSRALHGGNYHLRARLL